MKTLLLTTSCIAAIACAAQAFAQDQAAPAAPTPEATVNAPDRTNAEVGAPTPGQQRAPANATNAPATPGGLEELVVTAQRRSESLQHAAIAVTAVTGDTIRDAGVTKPTELTNVVPALQVATSAGPYSLFYVRGVGNFNGNALSDSAVAFNFNGVYVGRPSSTTGFFYDLERVEVLKGPQGTLYGRNATGGAINVLPHMPELGQLGGDVVAEYGNYNTFQLDGALNVPLGDKAAMRLAGIYVRHDGYNEDGTDDQRDAGLRLSFLARPTENLKLSLVADYFHQGGHGPGSTPIDLGVDNRYGEAAPESVAFYQTQPVSVAGRNFNGVTPTPNMDNDSYGVSASVDWTLPFGTLTFIPAYRGAHVDYLTTTPGFQIAQRENDDQYSGELRFASNEDHPFRYLFGGFIYDELNSVPLYDVNSQYNASFQNYRAKTTSEAAFGRLTYAFTPSIRATIGARYTNEDKSFQGNYFSMNRLCINFPAFQAGQGVQITGPCPGAAPFPYSGTTPPPALIPFNPAFPFVGFNEIYGQTAIFQTATPINSDRKATFDKFTYRAGLDWDITSQNLLYASYETGFKSGGFFFSADSGVYKPEKIQAYTIGSKNRFLSNRLQLNLELFYWKYQDQQISHLGQDSQGNIIFPTENVGRASFKGGELETKYLLTENTLLTADIQYLDAKYDQFLYNVPNQGPPLTGCSQVGTPTTVITLDCSGFRPPNAPEWTVNLGAQQTIPLSNSGKVVINGRAHYQTETLTGLEFVPVEEQDGYWQLDGSVTYAAPDDKYFVTAFINNATDETVIGNTFPPPLGHFVVGSLRPPRTFGVRIGAKF